MLNWLLPIAFAVLAVFTLVKDWTAYKKFSLRLVVLGVIVATGIGGAINNWIHDEDVRVQTDKLRWEIVGLKASVETAQKIQEDNTKQFMQTFGTWSQKLSDFQSQVKTAGLQKEAAELKAQLAATQQALIQPKATLDFTFAKPDIDAPPIQMVTLPVKDNIVHVEFTVRNWTDTPALDGEITIIICDACKFASEPRGFRTLPGQKDTHRIFSFDRIFPKTELKTLSADIQVPPNIDAILFGLNYRCRNCIVPEKASIGTVILDRQPRAAN